MLSTPRANKSQHVDAIGPLQGTSHACKMYGQALARQVELDIFFAVTSAAHRALCDDQEVMESGDANEAMRVAWRALPEFIDSVRRATKAALINAMATDPTIAQKVEASFDRAWQELGKVTVPEVLSPQEQGVPLRYRLSKATTAISSPLGALLIAASRSEGALSKFVRMVVRLAGAERVSGQAVFRHVGNVTKASGHFAAALPYVSALLDIYIHIYDYRSHARRRRNVSQIRVAMRAAAIDYAVALSTAAYQATIAVVEQTC